jgi:hypothetical protein
VTFILIDLSDETRDFQTQNRWWLPLAAEIKHSELISGERAETISHSLCTEVTKQEAWAIASHLVELLKSSKLPKGINRGEAQRFCSFASESNGFSVR